MEKQISIIIPTYNMENYLVKCLNSLLIPEIEQIEILIINDGSKDRSSYIAHQYERKYPNSIKVIDKENANYGSCINVALPEVTGRFVKILDADDSFDLRVFSHYVEYLRNIPDVDVVLSDYIRIDEEGKIIGSTTYNINSQRTILNYEHVKNALSKDCQMHGIAYSIKHLRNLNYNQTEGISYTDTEWTFIPIAKANKFAYFNKGALYKYLLGRDGQTMDPAIFHKKLSDQFKVLNSKAEKFERNRCDLESERLEFLANSFCKQAHYIYQGILISDNTNSKRQLKTFDDNLKKISIVLYNKLNEIRFSENNNFKMVTLFRKSPSPTTFHISLLNRLFGRMQRLMKF